MENKKEQEHGEQEEKIEIIFWYPGKYLDKLQSYFCFFLMCQIQGLWSPQDFSRENNSH